MSPANRMVIDRASRRNLRFLRDPTVGSGDLDANGDPAVKSYTVIVVTTVGDIQPASGRLKDSLLGTDENVAGMAGMTHVGFVERRVTGVKARDVIEDLQSLVRYLITYVRDWHNAPQVFYLKQMTDEG